jgi:hypothetical protein
VGARRIDPQRQLLDGERRSHRPGVVAEMTFELAADRRDREGRERAPTVGVIAIDRIDQRHRRDLNEVLERLS